MRIDRDQYAELVEKYADELVYDVMEKEAAGFGEAVKRSVSLISGSAKRNAAKDVSTAKDISAKHYKDLAESTKRLDGSQRLWDNILKERGRDPKFIDFEEAQSAMHHLDGFRYLNDARRTQGRKLIDNVNSAEATHALESKLTSSARKKALGGVGVAGVAGVAGKQGYNDYQSKKAAELLIEAVMYKQAAFNYMNESELVAEASARALNAMGYSL